MLSRKVIHKDLASVSANDEAESVCLPHVLDRVHRAGYSNLAADRNRFIQLT